MRQTVLDCLHGIVNGQVASSATALIEPRRDSPESKAMAAQFDTVLRARALSHRMGLVR